MENIIFEETKNEKDIAEIASWEKTFEGTKGFEKIKQYLFMDCVSLEIIFLSPLIDNDIGSDEKTRIVVMKEISNGKPEIVAFSIIIGISLSSKDPEMIIQYFGVRPDKQASGYGSMLLSHLLTEGERYLGKEPTVFSTHIDFRNKASQNLFQKFDFEPTGNNSLNLVEFAYSENENIKEQK